MPFCASPSAVAKPADAAAGDQDRSRVHQPDFPEMFERVFGAQRHP